MAVEEAVVEATEEKSVTLQERLFTVEEFERIVEAGIFGADERVELIEGRIVQMNPIGDDHAWTVIRSTGVLTRGADIFPWVQSPVRLSERTLPIADLSALRPDVIQNRKPEPADILLVVEVANTSLAYDRQVKAALYARANIPEYWIVDIKGERVEAYRDPSPIGYRSIRLFARGERLAPEFKPDLLVDVDAILGPPTSAN
jgi:Uma2 family endonuclease